MTTCTTTVSREIGAGSHVIAACAGTRPGPLFVAVGGIHGNEPAGVQAAHRIALALEDHASEIAGCVVLLAGNARALADGVRFLDADLNRHWTPERLESSRIQADPSCSETAELRELRRLLDGLIQGADDDVYVVDLHTTSAGGPAFATVATHFVTGASRPRFPCRSSSESRSNSTGLCSNT
jgi:succinylglutamate desuccinylase